MPKYYVTDDQNTFVVDTSSHIRACKLALEAWEKHNKIIGKFIRYTKGRGFSDIKKYNCVDKDFLRKING